MIKSLKIELNDIYKDYEKIFEPDMRGICKLKYIGNLDEIEKYKELENKKSAYILLLNKAIDYPKGSSKIFSIGYSDNLYKTLLKKKNKMEETNLEEKFNIYYPLTIYGAKVFIIENEDELPMNVEYHYVKAFNFLYGVNPAGNYYESNFKQSRLELKLKKLAII